MSDLASFVEHEKKCAAKAGAEVATNPLIFAYCKRWNRLDPKQKEDLARLLTEVSSSAMHVGFVGFQTFERAPVIRETEGSRSRSYTAGMHTQLRIDGKPSGSLVGFNKHPEVMENVSLGEIVEIPPHELAHRYQRLCIKNPGILPQQFRATIPKIFEENFSYYIQPEMGRTYYEQAVEVHAFAVGKAFTKSFLDFIANNNYVRNPYDQTIIEKEFRSGRVSVPVAGSERFNPYRHYYSGLLAENRLSGTPPDQQHFAWATAMSSYAEAVRCGEYLIPHDNRLALQRLCDIAENKMDCGLDVPAAIQERARRHLEAFKDSDRESVQHPVRRVLARLDKWGPLLSRDDVKGAPRQPTPV